MRSSLAFLLWIYSQAVYCQNFAGDYGEILLGYDEKTSILSGFYKSFTGMNQEFSCIFFFSGKLTGQTAKIKSYYPPDPQIIEGELSLKPKELTLVLHSEPPGCANVQHFSNPKALASFRQIKPYHWKSIRIVKSTKAPFHSAPKDKAVKKSYIVKGDAVGVIESRTSWIKAEFLGKKIVSGWLKASDFY